MTECPLTPEELEARNRTARYKKFAKFTKIEKTIMSFQQLKELAKEIEKGITLENGETRPFDIIDLGERKIPLSLEDLLEFASLRLSCKSEERAMRRALSKYRKIYGRVYDLTNQQIRDFIGQEDVEFDCKKSKFGKIVRDSGDVLSSEIKAGLIAHLVVNDVELTNSSVGLAVSRYHNNTLNVEPLNAEIVKQYFRVPENQEPKRRRKAPDTFKLYEGQRRKTSS